MKRLLLTILTLVFVVSGWLFVDAPLDEETRQWLEPPEPFEYDRSRLAQLAAYELPEQANASVSECTMEVSDGRSCVEWILDNLGIPFQNIPDDAYFELYDAILAEDRIQLTVLNSGVLDTSASMPLVAATNAVIMRDVVKHQRVLPATIARLLPQHRHHLAQSDLVIDWMVYTATTAILGNAATNAVQTGRSDDVDLTAALAPLTVEERSARRAFRGELRYGSDLMLREGRKIGQPIRVTNSSEFALHPEQIAS